MYPYFYYEEGDAGESYLDEPKSGLYQLIVYKNHLGEMSKIDEYAWPKQLYDLPSKAWFEVYSAFLDYDAYDKYPDPEMIPPNILRFTSIVGENEFPDKYTEYFGEPEQTGISVEIEICELRNHPDQYSILRESMERPEFPLFGEYQNVKKYYRMLKKRTQLESESDELFND